jgi:hypothetical protein
MHRLLPLVVAATLLAAVLALATPAGAVHDTGSAFVVQLDAEGDATVYVEDRYDLTNGSGGERFAAVRDNESRRAAMADRFTERLRAAAERAETATGRSMAVDGATVNVTGTEDAGVVRVESRWRGLAAVDHESGVVTVTEPFAGGFAVNRTLVVRGPPGYGRAGTSPEPDRALKNAAFWHQETDLSGFFARFARPTPTVAPITGAGLSAVTTAAAIALVPVLVLLLVLPRDDR